MPAKITHATRVHSAISFIENLSVNENVYLFAGKIDPWDDENSPDEILGTYQEAIEVKAGNVYIKKITKDDGALGIRRYDWTSGVVYTPWQSDTEMSITSNWLSTTQPYYAFVVDATGTSVQYNVYLCLDNNGGAPSTVSPTGQSIDSFVLNDGYRWKFIYNVSSSLMNFLTDVFVPCPHETSKKSQKHLEVQSNVIRGTIDKIKINATGSGYTVANSEIVISGDGTGCVASFELGTSGELTNVSIDAPGEGYTFATAVLVGDGDGNAVLEPMISPIGGHGYEACIQLNASYALINQGFVHDEGGLFPAQNSFRTVGLIKNVRDLDGNTLSSDKYNLFDELVVSNITGTFPLSQQIQGQSSGATALIYYQDPPGGASNASFFLANRRGDFQEGETVELVSNPGILAIVSGINNNAIDTLSGDIIYQENIQFLTRKTGQTEKFIFSIEY